jgi:diphosphomevalonate decarboxylase
MTTARAHPNIALIKYWGKQNQPGNLPATPSLSITLSELATTTTVHTAEMDAFRLNDRAVDDAKVADFVTRLRHEFGIPPLAIETENNFPTGAGLASSASGFAALATAIDAHCGLNLDTGGLSRWARMGSASAARSILQGFVTLAGPEWQAECLAPSTHWDLRIVVAVTDRTPKAVGSSEGMERTRTTSPYFNAWLETAETDFSEGCRAVETRDFDKLADVAEHSCMKMHGIMLTSKPALAYWNAATVECMHRLRALRAAGVPVFFTTDAGPQLKAICLPDALAAVESAIRGVVGVVDTIGCALGEGASVEPT